MKHFGQSVFLVRISYRVDKNQLWRPYFVKLTSQKGVHTCSVLQVLSTDNMMSKNRIIEKATVEKNPNIVMPVPQLIQFCSNANVTIV